MDPELNRFTLRCSFPYLHGVYLAVNALPRSALLVDGPVCAFTKAEQVFGTHDMQSDLLSSTSRHRIVHTRLHPDNLVDGNRDAFVEALRGLVEATFVEAVLTAPFPMAALAGSPHENWCAPLAATSTKPIVHVPGLSLTADWYQGYAQTLLALARQVPLPAATPDRDKVAIVGYFMDRNEEDHRGNVREMRRLLAALGLDLVTVWLGGVGVADLSRVAEAGTILSFPLGRAAAEAVAARTGAAVVRCELPFGPDATARWLRQVGAATGRAAEAERVVAAGLAECGERLRWLVLKRLVHGRWAFAGDPWLMPGLCEIARFVGARVRLLVPWTVRETDFERPIEWPCPVMAGLHTGRLKEVLRDAAPDIDLVIGNYLVAEEHLIPRELGYMEFGFPGLRHHAMHDEPYLGFAGLMCFAGRVANCFQDLDLGPEAIVGMDAL
ncbi:MAG: hypothetical protein FJ087_04275 [Deltaproteobacteria bacterium]|nr:hypothetical protein [Deltaproteobacteria bacterium]